MPLYDTVRDLPLGSKTLRREVAATNLVRSSRARRRPSSSSAAARRGSARTSPTTPTSTRRPLSAARARGRLDDRLVLDAPRASRALPAGAPDQHGVPRLPPLGLRIGRARPRAPPGGPSLGDALGREPRPVRFVSSTRATSLERWLELYPACASSSTRRRVDGRVGRRARGARAASTSSISRAQYTRHRRRQPGRTRSSTAASPRGFPSAWIEDPALDAGDRRRARAAPRPRSPGMRRSTRGPTSRRSPFPRAASTRSRRASARSSGSSSSTTAAPSTGSRSTAAASSSSGRARADPAARLALPSRRAERRRARRLQRAGAAGRPRDEPARPAARARASARAV